MPEQRCWEQGDERRMENSRVKFMEDLLNHIRDSIEGFDIKRS